MRELALYLYRPMDWRRVLAWLPSIVGLALLVASTIYYHSLRSERDDWLARLHQLQRAVHPKPKAVHAMTEDERQPLDGLARIVGQLNDSPLPVLDVLAKLLDQTVALDGVEWKEGVPELTLSIEAKDAVAMYGFWTKLATYPGFTDVRLLEHTQEPRTGYQVEMARFKLRLTGTLPPVPAKLLAKPSAGLSVPPQTVASHLKQHA